jgi:hypothetical protein
MSVTRHHAEWLSLIEVSGPFLSMPVLMRVFPQGLDPREPDKAKELRLAYEEWLEKPNAPGWHQAWVRFVLTRFLEFPENLVLERQSIPYGIEARMAEYGEMLRPDYAVVAPPGHVSAGKAHLLLQVYPPGQNLDGPVAGKHWKASPATRMTELLHAVDIPLGMITNGEEWMLVYAPRNETSGYASWYAGIWQEEPITLRAFSSVMHARRFFGVVEGDTLPALLKESAQDQQEVTDQLGLQVRRAVEVLVQAFDRLDQESGRKLLCNIEPKELYDAALTVMMRLVFLFSAEERRMLRLGESLYDENYAASTLREQLREAADQHGEEVLERRFDAWSRLLATFRAVYGGIAHETLRLPTYGGTLFEPDRYPFLEGRPTGTDWRRIPAEPLAINNRVVLHLLESLQLLQMKVPGGGPAEARRLSFRALDIVQIGHVYEGLLNHTAVRATTIIIGLHGTKNSEPEIPLEKLEQLRADGKEPLIEYLKEETKRSEPALRRALMEANESNDHKLLIACGQDVRQRDRIQPFAGLLRMDSFEMPVVILPGSVYVTEGTTRRSTGTHYTPKSLTEPIVQHTLEPLVYEGPAEGWPKEKWKLKSPREILALRVCDMTMGSGAFLVQSCRYLAERLAEAWENMEQANPGSFVVTPDGELSTGDPAERLLPRDLDERLIIARRAVADQCLYGVDINPMAVEMAKLSLWLVTMQKDRPFTFLDHALKCGDSLLGITSIEQLENFSLRPGGGKQMAFATLKLRLHIDKAKKKREALEAWPSDTPEQIAAKVALYAEAEEAVAKLNAAADVLVAFELKGVKGRAYEAERDFLAECISTSWDNGTYDPMSCYRHRPEERRFLHWAIVFPEIACKGFFDAVVGNPPYMWGQRISTRLGEDYFGGLRQFYPNVNGVADLIAYFFLRGLSIVTSGGTLGLVATDTLHRGDTRESSLDIAIADGWSIYRATTDHNWLGAATVKFCTVHLTRRAYAGEVVLDDRKVRSINSHLDPLVETTVSVQETYKLKSSIASYVGSYIYGDGFLLTHEQADRICNQDPSCVQVIKPYLIGDDVLSDPQCRPSRSVIDFGSMTEEQAKHFEPCFTQVKRTVFPIRQTQKRESRKRYWWQYGEKAAELYKAIQPLDTVLVHPYVSTYLCFARVPSRYIYASPMVVVVTDDLRDFFLLQNSLHEIWILTYYCSRLGSGIRYTTSDGLSKYPLPVESQLDDRMRTLAAAYLEIRHGIVKDRQEGLTKVYRRFHEASETSVDIAQLRARHVEIDLAVAAAYGWQDIDLTRDFHETKQGTRYTISEAARREVLERLLALNHERYEEEVKAGLHEKKAAKGSGKRRKKKSPSDKKELQYKIFEE